MGQNLNETLILVSAELTVGIDGINSIMKSLSKGLTEFTISSLYKKYHTHRREDLNCEIVLVIRARTAYSIPELHSLVNSTSTTILSGRRFTVLVLTYNNEVRMSPTTPLPDPRLHSDMLILKCATEVFGDYPHPILGKSLDQIFRKVNSMELTEFFAQPKAVEK